jgi:hypothetical protein
MAMPKIYAEMNDKLDRILQMLEALQAKPAATPRATPAGAPIMQVDETTAAKLDKGGDFAPVRPTAAQEARTGSPAMQSGRTTPKSK